MLDLKFPEAFPAEPEVVEEPAAQTVPMSEDLVRALEYIHKVSNLAPEVLMGIYQGLRNTSHLASFVGQRVTEPTNLEMVLTELSSGMGSHHTLFRVLRNGKGDPAANFMIFLAQQLRSLEVPHARNEAESS